MPAPDVQAQVRAAKGGKRVFDLDRFAAIPDRIFGAAREMTAEAHPIGRWGTPREVAEAVLFMCSDKSSFMTGHYIVTDGGFLVGPKAAD